MNTTFLYFSSELTTWLYQHSSSIESTRVFLDDITIKEFAIVSNKVDSKIIYVLIITNNHWIEIYPAASLQHEPLLNLHLQAASRVHSTPHGMFYVITCEGSIYCIDQQIVSNEEIKFSQTATAQIKFPCSMMFSTSLTLNGLESLVVFSDNWQVMAIWTMKRIIYVDINIPTCVSSSQLKSITGESSQNLLLLHFNDMNLISCQLNLVESNEKCSVQLNPFDKAYKFCLKKDCLAAYNNGTTELSLHNIRASTCYEPIQLENECQQLCLNESATYVFALVKPRVLFMYRIDDRKQLAKLFVYDFVSFITADNDFLVLAMNDRRLLTLMIADPDDPTVQSKIQALPSRYVSIN